MTVDEIRAAIRAKTGCLTFVQATTAGTAIGVPSSERGIAHWSLVPIDDESRPRFVDFMVSLNGTRPTAPRQFSTRSGDKLDAEVRQ